MTHDKDAKNDENYLADLIMDFVEYIEIERGRSIRTAENYNLYMDRLVEFAGNIPVSQITDEPIARSKVDGTINGLTSVNGSVNWRGKRLEKYAAKVIRHPNNRTAA